MTKVIPCPKRIQMFELEVSASISLWCQIFFFNAQYRVEIFFLPRRVIIAILFFRIKQVLESVDNNHIYLLIINFREEQPTFWLPEFQEIIKSWNEGRCLKFFSIHGSSAKPYFSRNVLILETYNNPRIVFLLDSIFPNFSNVWNLRIIKE